MSKGICTLALLIQIVYRAQILVHMLLTQKRAIIALWINLEITRSSSRSTQILSEGERRRNNKKCRKGQEIRESKFLRIKKFLISMMFMVALLAQGQRLTSLATVIQTNSENF